MESWYTLYTKPNAEHKVAVTLDERGIETFVPEIFNPKKSYNGRPAPFFPCYLFMHVDLGELNSSQWQWTPGLRNIVAFDGMPVPVSEQAIDLIRQTLAELNNGEEQPLQKFSPGDIVRIKNGPFADLLALFEGQTTAAERVTVLLNFLGSFSRVRLGVDNLEKAPAGVQIDPPERMRRTRGRGRRINYSDNLEPSILGEATG
jgi:transcription antitermination factor NusG